MLPLGLFSMYCFRHFRLILDSAAGFQIFLDLALKIVPQLIFFLLALVWHDWIIDSHSVFAVFCKFL